MNLINDEIKIDWTKDTRDKGDHLNHTGAVKASEYLSRYLEESKLLSDHRNDNNYKSWNELYKRYLKQMEGKHL